jgi:hypothetical protein
MVPPVPVPVTPTPPANAEWKIIIVPIAITPALANLSGYVKSTAVAPAAGPVAVVATTPVVARPHVVAPTFIVAVKIAFAEVAITAFTGSEITLTIVYLSTAIRIADATGQVASLELLIISLELLVTTEFALEVAVSRIARLLVTAILRHLQKITHPIFRRSIRLIAVLVLLCLSLHPRRAHPGIAAGAERLLIANLPTVSRRSA